MLVRTGSMQIRVDSLAVALARAESVAVGLGAYVSAASASGTPDGLHAAAVTIRVPAQAWDRLLGGLGRLGSVERVSTEAQDVGEEYVDVEARLANGRRLEARILALLAVRTGRLSDVLAAEHELARVRENMETLEGRRRYLAASVARSTLRVEFVAGSVAAGVAERGMFRLAARDALTSFLWLIAFAIRVSGVVVPLAAVTMLVWVLWQRQVRLNERRAVPVNRQLDVS
jgi:hypothetical protein